MCQIDIKQKIYVDYKYRINYSRKFLLCASAISCSSILCINAFYKSELAPVIFKKSLHFVN